MDNIGEILKNARLDKGLSLEQAEEATSIRKIYLAAVEAGEYAKVPGDVFTKGIIRTYGNYLGLNGPELVTLHNLKDDSPALMSQYDVLILGIPTWDFGEIQEDWEAVWDQLDTLNLEGKIVALYGMGDQLGYGEWFLDALGMLHDKLATRGVKFVGYWPTEGYEFTSPKPVIADGQLFVGLALDETNQYDLSDERIQSWCEQILGEMAEHFS